MTPTVTIFIVKVFYCIVLEKNKSRITHNIKMCLSTCTVSHFPTLIKSVPSQVSSFFKGYIFRVTLTVTVFIFNLFYCIVLEKNKSKITHNNKMRLSTCTLSLFPTLIKVYRHRLAHSFNGYVYKVTLTVTVFIFNLFYCIVLEKNKSRITHKNKMRLSTCTVSHVPTLIKSVPS